MKILIVDDEPIILNGIVSLVSDCIEDAQIEQASDGFEALDRLETFKPDVLISDVNMPEMSGLQLIEETKRRGWCRRFIILSGYDEFEYARQAVRLGVMDYLLKPVQKVELQSAITRVFESITENGEMASLVTPNAVDEEGHHITVAVLRYIRGHYQQDLSLDDVADHVGIHPNYLCTVLKQSSGKSFVQFVREYRIEKARELLRAHPGVRIEKVASAVGYEQPRHFFKVFKRLTGLTPGEYRDGRTDVQEER